MRKKAFTLLETLVAVVVAGIILSAAMGGYVSVFRANIKADVSRQMQKEVHFALILMVDRMRAFSVNYPEYTTGSGACQGLSLSQSNPKLCVGEEGRETVFWNDGDTVTMDGARLFSEVFHAEVSFTVTPTKDPFDPDHIADRTAQLQPKVKIFLRVASKLLPDVQMSVQTTVSSRKYE